jgi:hypothetical protein
MVFPDLSCSMDCPKTWWEIASRFFEGSWPARNEMILFLAAFRIEVKNEYAHTQGPPITSTSRISGITVAPDHPTRSESRIEATFHAALSRPAGDREAYMAEACAGKEELLREVRAVLKAHEEAGDFLNAGEPSPAIKAELARLKPEEADERVGPYKLLQQIGEGGFGMDRFLPRGARWV